MATTQTAGKAQQASEYVTITLRMSPIACHFEMNMSDDESAPPEQLSGALPQKLEPASSPHHDDSKVSFEPEPAREPL